MNLTFTSNPPYNTTQFFPKTTTSFPGSKTPRKRPWSRRERAKTTSPPSPRRRSIDFSFMARAHCFRWQPWRFAGWPHAAQLTSEAPRPPVERCFCGLRAPPLPPRAHITSLRAQPPIPPVRKKAGERRP